MTRVLLADDEPLVLIGMQSMLDWNALGYELVGTARNGGEALEKIDELQPDIVVSDIRMPVLDGLQLAARVHEQYGPLPVFIMLTSYEEFDYVRRSMGLGAVDYLIKMDLTADGLREALERARTAIKKEKALRAPAPPAPGSLESYRERFFIQLYSGAFPNDEVIRTYCRELGLKPDAAAYTAVIANIRNRDLTPEQQVALSAGVTRMAADILPKYLRCQVTGMDLRHFNVLLLLDSRTGWEETLAPILQKVNDILYKYFSTTLWWAVGAPTSVLHHIPKSQKDRVLGAAAAQRAGTHRVLPRRGQHPAGPPRAHRGRSAGLHPQKPRQKTLAQRRGGGVQFQPRVPQPAVQPKRRGQLCGVRDRDAHRRRQGADGLDRPQDL